jgi:hypothetical protein
MPRHEPARSVTRAVEPRTRLRECELVHVERQGDDDEQDRELRPRERRQRERNEQPHVVPRTRRDRCLL